MDPIACWHTGILVHAASNYTHTQGTPGSLHFHQLTLLLNWRSWLPFCYVTLGQYIHHPGQGTGAVLHLVKAGGRGRGELGRLSL